MEINICRLCLQTEKVTKISDTDPFMRFVPRSVARALEQSPLTCISCVDMVEAATQLVTHLKKTEQKIKEHNVQDKSTTIELKSLNSGLSNLPDYVSLCRLCLRVIRKPNLFLCENSSNILRHDLLREMLKFCNVKLNLAVSEKPVMCIECWQLLQASYAFKKTFTEVEKKLWFYCKHLVIPYRTHIVNERKFLLKVRTFFEDNPEQYINSSQKSDLQIKFDPDKSVNSEYRRRKSLRKYSPRKIKQIKPGLKQEEIMSINEEHNYFCPKIPSSNIESKSIEKIFSKSNGKSGSNINEISESMSNEESKRNEESERKSNEESKRKEESRRKSSEESESKFNDESENESSAASNIKTEKSNCKDTLGRKQKINFSAEDDRTLLRIYYRISRNGELIGLWKKVWQIWCKIEKKKVHSQYTLYKRFHLCIQKNLVSPAEREKIIAEVRKELRTDNTNMTTPENTYAEAKDSKKTCDKPNVSTEVQSRPAIRTELDLEDVDVDIEGHHHRQSFDSSSEEAVPSSFTPHIKSEPLSDIEIELVEPKLELDMESDYDSDISLPLLERMDLPDMSIQIENIHSVDDKRDALNSLLNNEFSFDIPLDSQDLGLKRKSAVWDKTKQSGDGLFKCLECNFETKFRACVDRHATWHSKSKKVYHCTSCPYKITNKLLYKQHMKEHEDDMDDIPVLTPST